MLITISRRLNQTFNSAKSAPTTPKNGAIAYPIGEGAQAFCAEAASIGLDLLFLFHHGKRKGENAL